MTDTAPNTRTASGQELTVVLMQLAGEPALEACRKALSVQADAVIIVRPEPGAGNESLPARRLRGLHTANSPFVAFLEDTCIPGPGWCAAIRGAFENPDIAGVGGPVEISRQLPARFRALAVCEYARFQASRLPKASDHVPVGSLAGANFAVRKSAMADASSPADMIDNAMFENLRSRGTVLMEHNAGVTYAAQDNHGARLSTRFHHGRIYGGGRAAGKSLPVRLALALRTLVVPALLTVRSFRDAPGWLWSFPSTVMWILLMHGAWSAGEFCGVITGKVGNSLKEWA